MALSTVSMDSLLARLEAARTTAAGLPQGVGPKPSAKSAAGPDFVTLLKGTIDRVDAAQQNSTALAARFQMGDSSVSLEESMIAMQKASVTFQAAVQVRNKVVAAYQDIMNLPI
jgi:flagellar hook-basal body complex protein FliE